MHPILQVTLVFVKVSHVDQLSQWDIALATDAVNHLAARLGRLIHSYNGYPCEEEAGLFLLAFHK